MKVFGIGFQKTGTKSLNRFFRSVGFRSIHWPHSVNGVNYEKMCGTCLTSKKLVVDTLAPVIESHDAFTDVPFPALYTELHRRYKESRFVLVTRDSDQWWESVARHWQLKNRRTRRLDPYEYLQYNNYASSELSVVSAKDRVLLQNIHRQHVDEVLSFFVNYSDQLLAIDLSDPNKAEKLSEFLELDSRNPYPNVKRKSPSHGPPSMRRWRP
ncbi:MAG: hypothetical protein OEQ39_24530 [Gammaproteobacteria bacterium]|nr:hypothetical protein [Gammaproteobacteria bacterium]MDH3464351.1 hypothetical protein [Gammaproteobacteria bacterium]